MNGKVVAVVISVIVIAAAAGGIAFFLSNQQTDDITYSLDGGTNSPDNRARYDGNVIELSDPSKTGYDFCGWYTDKNLTNKVTSVGPDDGKLMLYAKWSLHNYKISYDIDDSVKNDNPQTCTLNDTVVLKAAELKGYIFDAWHLKDTGETVTELSDVISDVGLYATFTPVDYTVTYHTDGTSVNDNPDKVKISDVIELKDPVRAGYDFEGWYTADTFSSESRIDILRNVSSDISLYAKWSIITYAITYSDGGAFVNLNPTECTCADTVKLADPLRINYAFEGWYSDEALTQKVTELKGVCADTTVYAKYTELAGQKYQYSISGTMEISSINFDLGGTITARYSNYHETQYLYSTGYLFELSYGDAEYVSYLYNSSVHDLYSSASVMFEGGTFSQMEYIDTIDGKIYAFKIIDGSEYVYYGSNGVVYHGYANASGMSALLTLDSKTGTEVKDNYTISVRYSDAVTSVTGDGTYPAGQQVDLSYNLSSGCSFKYWIPQDLTGEFISSSLVIENISEDLDLYAWCEGDQIFTENYKDPNWTVKDGMTGNTVYTANLSTLLINVPAGHYYIIDYTGKTTGWWTKTVSKTYFASGGGSATISYSWNYNSHTYNMDWSADVDTYVEYRQKELDSRSQSYDDSEDVRFVEYNAQYIKDITALLGSNVSGLTELQFATYILCFVQEAIPYEYDSDNDGETEYWKYPYETLFDKGGDCEDTSILYCTLMKSYGYGSALLLFTGFQYLGIGHCASAIDIEGASGVYYEVDGVRYYYCETTGTGWIVGERPEEYDSARVIVVP